VAPEVWEGAPEFTPGVDLFAVGCIAYSLITRRRLFDGENVASIYGACLVVSATPRGAKVWVDGTLQDRKAGAPFGLTVAPGSHRVGMGMVSSAAVEHVLTITAGAAKGVHCTLTGEQGCRSSEAEMAACD
jgi:hypothetical protein